MTISNTNLLPSQQAAVVGIIDPDAYAAAAYNTVWISMADWGAVQAIVMAGTLGASATLDAKLEQAQDAVGTGAKDITGKAITQLTKAAADDDNLVARTHAHHPLGVFQIAIGDHTVQIMAGQWDDERI